MNQIIISAIRDKKCLSFSYNGQQRLVEPHAYGVSSKGNEILRAYQIQGGHFSNHKDGWHLFSLSKINFLTLSETKFSTSRDGYKPGDEAMERIYAEL